MACAICAIIYLGCMSPRSSLQHTRNSNETSRLLFLLCLAPDGGYLAIHITANAGGLLHHHFTITSPSSPKSKWIWGRCPKGGGGSCLFLWPFSGRLTPPRRLSDAVLCGVRTFLEPACARPRLPDQPEKFHHTRARHVRQQSNGGHFKKRH